MIKNPTQNKDQIGAQIGTKNEEVNPEALALTAIS